MFTEKFFDVTLSLTFGGKYTVDKREPVNVLNGTPG